MHLFKQETGKFTEMANGPGQALEAEIRSYANYEPFTIKGNWKIQIMEISKEEFISTGPRSLNFYVNSFCEVMRWVRGEQGGPRSCSGGCDGIICKLGPLHPKQLPMLENTHYGNQIDERLNSWKVKDRSGLCDPSATWK